MRKGSIVLGVLISVISFSLFAASTKTADKMVHFNSSKYSGSFSLLIPSTWMQSASYSSDVPTYYFSNSGAVISVKVFDIINNDIEDIVRSEFILLLDKDPLCSQILDTDTYTTFGNNYNRIVVHEYREPSTRRQTVQRSYFIKTDSRIFVVQCRAPRATFYAYEPTFSSSMGSFRTAVIPRKKPDIIENKEPVAPPVAPIEEKTIEEPQKDVPTPEDKKQEDESVKPSADENTKAVEPEKDDSLIQPEVKSGLDAGSENQKPADTIAQPIIESQQEEKKDVPPYSSQSLIQ